MEIVAKVVFSILEITTFWAGPKNYKGLFSILKKGGCIYNSMTTIFLKCVNPHCGNDEVVNAISGIDTDSVDDFLEGFGHGAEDDEDYCPECGELASPEQVVDIDERSTSFITN